MKQKNLKKREPSDFRRLKLEVEEWNKKQGIEISVETSVKSRPQISRKRRRKEARQLKKTKKHEYFSGKKGIPQNIVATKGTGDYQAIPGKDDSVKSTTEGKKSDMSKTGKKHKKKKKKKKTPKNSQMESLKKANEEEDVTIQLLEKRLKLNKKKLQAAFRNDGLNDLLEFCDSENRGTLLDLGDGDIFREESESDEESTEIPPQILKEKSKKEKEKINDDQDDEPGEDEENDDDEEEEMEEEHLDREDDSELGYNEDTAIDLVESRKRTGSTTGGKSEVYITNKKRKTDKQDENLHLIKKQKIETDEVSDEGELGSNDDENAKKTTRKRKRKRQDIKYDIYGRVIGGSEEKTEVYVPPQQRARMMGKDENREKLDRLRRQVKGLLNRLSESNMQSVASQIEELYLKYSRNDMNQTLTGLILDSCVSSVLTPERLAMEHVMLIAVLHIRVGNEIGAHLIQNLANQFDDLYQTNGNYGDGKEADNILALLAHFYNFKIIHCVLIYDIIRKMIERFIERDIELLLLLLKNVGLTLRRDDPLSLKDVILQIQSKAADAKDKFKDQARVKFMLDTICALKNNNLRKIPNYDPSHLEHLKKLLKAFTKDHSSSDSQLRISLSDLLSAEEKGRWWVVGSAWVGQQTMQQQSENKPTITVHNEVSSKILDLSRKQRMNTDTRRNIFCVIVTSEDYVDAFDKLLHLNLKDRQEREIVYVLLDCCLQEKSFNPYYGYLSSKFCLYDRRFQIAFQFAFWDKFKVLDQLSSEQLSNLAKLLVHLLVSKSLALSVLKVINFAKLDKPMMIWLRQALMELLLEKTKDISMDVFARIAPYPKLHSLRDGLRLFMRQFLLRNQQKFAESTRERLKLMVQMADGALQGHDSSMML